MIKKPKLANAVSQSEKFPVKVSVCVLSYNHEKYIEQCLQSLVQQQCDFDFEVIVSDDCSTDGSQNIIKRFEREYPNIIKAFYHSKNIGGSNNYLFIHEQVSGEYIAYLDGDDYALPGKLQAQADFMDKTPDCNICFHRVKVLINNEKLLDDLINYEQVKNGFNKQDLIKYISVGVHSSKMHRARVNKYDIPNFEVTDFYANVEQVQTGKIYFISDKFYGVYRKSNGISSDGVKIKELILKTYKYFLNKYPEFRVEINSTILFLALADFKNNRSTKWRYFVFWIKCFHPYSFYFLFMDYKFRKKFSMPSY